jgi:hypothetical protein
MNGWGLIIVDSDDIREELRAKHSEMLTTESALVE